MTRRPRKRTLLMVLLLLAGGAIINVAVAWGLVIEFEGSLQTDEPSLFTYGSNRRHASISSEERSVLLLLGWQPPSDDTMFTYLVEQEHHCTFGCMITFYLIQPRLRPQTGLPPVGLLFSPPVFLQHTRTGWPCRSLNAYRFFDSHQATYFNTVVERVAGGVELGSSNPTRLGALNIARLVPLLPLWPGFAINTIFYAAILWLLFTLPFALRRHRRIKRGLCPACAYPVGTSPVCTECGKPVNVKELTHDSTSA